MTTGMRRATACPVAPSSSGKLPPSRHETPFSAILSYRPRAVSTIEMLPATVPRSLRLWASRRFRSVPTRRSVYMSATAVPSANPSAAGASTEEPSSSTRMT
jgi:hypothetical protein